MEAGMVPGIPQQPDLESYCREIAVRAATAAAELATISGDSKNRWLRESAVAIRDATASVLDANRLDIEAAPEYGLTLRRSTVCDSPRSELIRLRAG
jgi:glutamate-5-semialdehyde dehydrogenase